MKLSFNQDQQVIPHQNLAKPDEKDQPSTLNWRINPSPVQAMQNSQFLTVLKEQQKAERIKKVLIRVGQNHKKFQKVRSQDKDKKSNLLRTAHNIQDEQQKQVIVQEKNINWHARYYLTSFQDSTFSTAELVNKINRPCPPVLKALKDSHPYYTQLPKDGNSFYHAVAIAFTMQSGDWPFETYFPDVLIDNINNIKIKKDLNESQFFENILEGYKQAAEAFVNNPQLFEDKDRKALQEAFMKSYVVDFLLILCLRALTYEAIKKCQYLKESPLTQSLMTSAITYGVQPSSWEQIKCCSDALGCQLRIVSIDENYKTSTEIYKITDVKRQTIIRLPIFKMKDSYHPLYSTRRALTPGNSAYPHAKKREQDLLNEKQKFENILKQSSLSDILASEQTPSKELKARPDNKVYSHQNPQPNTFAKNKVLIGVQQIIDKNANKNTKRMKNKNLIVLALVLLFSILAIYGFLFYKSRKQETQWPAREVNLVSQGSRKDARVQGQGNQRSQAEL